MKFIRTISQVQYTETTVYGNRACDLAHLHAGNVPVPPTFVLTTAAWNLFLEKNSLQYKIDFILKQVDVKNEKTMVSAYNSIRKLLIANEIPAEIVAEIREAYESLSEGAALDEMMKEDNAPFVSMIASPNYVAQAESFEGIVQNIRGVEEFIYALKEVYAMHYTPEALKYQAEVGMKELRIALIIQTMPAATASATAYSTDPEHTDKIFIHTYKGYSDLRDLVAKDFFHVKKEFLNVSASQVVEQTKIIIRDDDGHLYPEEFNGRDQSLNDKEVMEVARIAKKSEKILQSPAKLFFTIADDAYFVSFANRYGLPGGMQLRVEAPESQEVQDPSAQESQETQQAPAVQAGQAAASAVGTGAAIHSAAATSLEAEQQTAPSTQESEPTVEKSAWPSPTAPADQQTTEHTVEQHTTEHADEQHTQEHISSHDQPITDMPLDVEESVSLQPPDENPQAGKLEAYAASKLGMASVGEAAEESIFDQQSTQDTVQTTHDTQSPNDAESTSVFEDVDDTAAVEFVEAAEQVRVQSNTSFAIEQDDESDAHKGKDDVEYESKVAHEDTGLEHSEADTVNEDDDETITEDDQGEGSDDDEEYEYVEVEVDDDGNEIETDEETEDDETDEEVESDEDVEYEDDTEDDETDDAQEEAEDDVEYEDDDVEDTDGEVEDDGDNEEDEANTQSADDEQDDDDEYEYVEVEVDDDGNEIETDEETEDDEDETDDEEVESDDDVEYEDDDEDVKDGDETDAEDDDGEEAEDDIEYEDDDETEVSDEVEDDETENDEDASASDDDVAEDFPEESDELVNDETAEDDLDEEDAVPGKSEDSQEYESLTADTGEDDDTEENYLEEEPIKEEADELEDDAEAEMNEAADLSTNEPLAQDAADQEETKDMINKSFRIMYAELVKIYERSGDQAPDTITALIQKGTQQGVFNIASLFEALQVKKKARSGEVISEAEKTLVLNTLNTVMQQN